MLKVRYGITSLQVLVFTMLGTELVIACLTSWALSSDISMLLARRMYTNLYLVPQHLSKSQLNNWSGVKRELRRAWKAA